MTGPVTPFWYGLMVAAGTITITTCQDNEEQARKNAKERSEGNPYAVFNLFGPNHMDKLVEWLSEEITSGDPVEEAKNVIFGMKKMFDETAKEKGFKR